MTVVAVVSDFRKARSGGFIGPTHRLGGRRFGCTRDDDLFAHVDLRALARPEGLGPLLEFLCRLATAATDAQAVGIRVRTIRAGGGVTGKPSLLSADRGWART